MAFVKNPGRPIELDGVRYVMPPLSLGAMEQLDEEQLRLLTEQGPVSRERTKLYIDMVHAALLRNYPDIERPLVADGMDLGNMTKYLRALMETSGLTKDEDDEPLGESSAIEQPSGSTSSPTSLPTPDGLSSTSAST